MAALCTGISYGLSQSCLSNENKELIFVKLTDSAYRAIEEYQKNQNKLNSHATIQFLGNDGYLSFPSLSNSGGQKFSFTIAETEGLQGSFECIQQNQSQLEVLGSLPNKMRIQANEDVYEVTRHRMAVAEENQKNKCTREIKPNQTDIGRKVKVKPSMNRLSNIPNNNILNKRDSISSSSSFVNSSSNSLNSNINNNHNSLTASSLKTFNIHQQQQPQQQQQQHLQQQQQLQLQQQQQQQPHNQHQQNGSINSNANNNQTTTMGSSGMNVVPSRAANSRPLSGRGIPDIMKRPIKERLIHLLALRPYKKPELYARITNEGVRDREKPCIGTLLKQLSFMRDNTYHLHRHIWNDVHEDWPFYTEQDRQILKRRKPQNLTPPLSSDGGSSTSGQSPTSTHNGSPPPAVKRPPLNGDKYLDGPIIKKQRISHFKKDVVNQDNARSDLKRHIEMVPNNEYSIDMNCRRSLVDSRESANLNARSRDPDELSIRSSNYYGSTVTPNAQESEDSGLSLSYSILGSEAAKRISSSSSSIGEQDHDEDSQVLRQKDRKNNGNGNTSYDFSQFTRITSIDQRRQYKTEFDNDYAEYMRLHADTERISKRFTQLEERLRSEEHNDQRYKEIQRQILNEFKQTMHDSRHQEDKKRFQYLHHKLSHIKRLVNDFDSSITKGKATLQENY